MLNAKLTVVGGDAKASEIQLRLPTVIGRGREASLTLPHPLVSRRHTEIFELDGRLVVRDLGSLNGTFVNNQRIEGDQVLEPNQLLTLGNVTFRAIYEIAATPELSHALAATDIEVSEKVAVRQNMDTEPSPEIEPAGDQQAGGVRLSTVEIESDPAASIEPKGRTDAAQSANRNSSTHPSARMNAQVDVGKPGPQHSVSMSQLNALPGPSSSSIDLAGPLELENATPQAASTIDPADFQFDGVDNNSAVAPSQSDLGSFLKKLPR